MEGDNCCKNPAKMTPSEAASRYGKVLTDFEKSEIHEYPIVWFLGDKAQKILGTTRPDGNFGYDDSNSRYLATNHDHIQYRYEILSKLGKGAFGDVYKAYDHATKQFVALKIIRNEKRFHRQGKMEVKVLNMLRDKDPNQEHSCVQMLDTFTFRNHLCITFEMGFRDLYDELKADGFRGLDPERVQEIARDIIKCLKYLSEQNIVHCDLKPENILLMDNGKVKIIDFGLSCFIDEQVLTYIQSRWYRAPEIGGRSGYGTPIDMWSLGCILVELTTGNPLFPAKNKYNLADLHAKLFDPEDKWTLKAACENQDPMFVDFVSKCLTLDPADRMTPIQAQGHAYLRDLPSPSSYSIDSGMGMEE